MCQLYFIYLFFLLTKCACAVNNGSFPDNFIFGVATASFQIEGAWNEDGKSENIWDHFTHQIPSPIANNDTADIACDSYHKYKEDVALAAAMGVQFFRFSISWTRILPTGYNDQINQKGMEFYKNLTDEILKYNMTPVATIYHWDLPQALVDKGWDSPEIVDLFVNYSRVVIQNLPNVGVWITINEPRLICRYGYGRAVFAPARNSSGLAEYDCAYYVLKAHAKTYHMYKDEFPHYTAKMTITLDCQWYEPLTNTIEDREAMTRVLNFECGLYIHPLYVGDWPETVKRRVYERSMKENHAQSRLTEFTTEEIQYINGTTDFFALNYYFTNLVSNVEESDTNVTSWENDVRVQTHPIPGTKLTYNNHPIFPSGLTSVLKYIKDECGNPEIYLTELGVCEDGLSLEDDIRIEYFTGHFSAILDAIYEYNVNVRGVAAWSLLDNFEWADGYKYHFGIYHVDFNSPNRTRTPKKSVEFFKYITNSRRLPTSGNETGNNNDTSNESQEGSNSQEGNNSASRRVNSYLVIIFFFLFSIYCC